MTYRFLVRVYESEAGITIAIMDEGLSKILRDKSLDFYKGEVIEEDKLRTLIENNLDKLISINALGQKAVNLVLNMKMAKEENVKYYKGIPHLIVVIL